MLRRILAAFTACIFCTSQVTQVAWAQEVTPTKSVQNDDPALPLAQVQGQQGAQANQLQGMQAQAAAMVPQTLPRAHEPPVLHLPAQQTGPEGEPLVIPFIVDVPNNDQINYSVEYLINGVVQKALPSGASLETNLKTAKRSLNWAPGFDQAGVYDFLFKAVDEKGASAEKKVTITVEDRKETPAIRVIYPVDYGNGPLFPSGGRVVVQGPGLFRARIDVSDPEGDPVKLEVRGIPGATFQPDYYGPNMAAWYWYTGYEDAGVYEGTVIATDSKGHKTEFPLTLEVRKTWHYDVRAYAQLTVGESQAEPVPVVRGSNVPLSMKLKTGYSWTEVDSTGLSGEYVLLTPDGERAISPVLKDSFATTWNSTTVPDGTYAVAFRLMDGPTLDRFRPRLTQVVVDNIPGSVVGPQRIPVTGFEYLSHHDPAAIDWVTYSGEREHATPHPYPSKEVPAAHDLPDSNVLLNAKNWFVEPLTQSISGLYEASPTFYSTRGADVITAGFYPQVGATSEGSVDHAQRHDHFDGGRDDNSTCPYSTFVPNPDGRGFIGVDLSGRVFRVDPDGTVTTIAGRMTSRDVLPYDYRDASIPIQQLYDHQKVTVGNFANNVLFNMPNDLAFDPRDSKILYVADTGNQRIAKIDFHGTRPVITTFAGIPGSAGHQDGPRGQAQFHSPYSLAVDAAGVIYVADEENHAIRKITPDGAVSTIVGTGSTPSPIPSPQVVRLDSKRNLIIGDSSTHTIYRVHPMNSQVETIAKNPWSGGHWMWLDVDRKGNVGPIDDILVAASTGGAGNTEFWRISADGSRANRAVPGGGTFLHDGLASMQGEAAGHYPWAVAIDDQEARFVTTGFGTSGLISFRSALPGDPVGYDYNAFNVGIGIYNTGTVHDFPFGSRPAFSALHGPRGHSRLGNVLNFDDLASFSDQKLARYIQDGMGGSVPRPEITGEDLANLIYFIRRNSLEGNLKEISVETIKKNLAGTEFWPDRNDVRAPEIRNVQMKQGDATTAKITWQTDEPTLGVVEFGPTDYYGLPTPIESTYTKWHEVLLTGLLPDREYHFLIRSKDKAGNQTVTSDRTFLVETGLPKNQPPVLNPIPDQTAKEGGKKTIPLSAKDPDGDALSFSLGQDAPSFATFAPDGTLTIDPKEGDVGPYSFTAIVTDSKGLKVDQKVLLTVTQDASKKIITTPHDKIPNFGYQPTIVAMRSGDWSDVSIWPMGHTPTDKDIVSVRSGVTLTINDQNAVADTLVIQKGGKLVFATDVNTKFKVANLLVLEGSELIVGTEQNPIAANVTAEIVIADQPIDLKVDPEQYGTGLIGLGKITMYGAAKTSGANSRLAVEPRLGDTTLTLEQPVSGWRVGDNVILPDTRQLRDSERGANYVPQWEQLTIAGVSSDGKVLTLSTSLKFDHLGARNSDGKLDFLPHVANLSRNVVVRSENPAGTRGHVLMTHRAEVDIEYAAVQNTGRTTIARIDNTTLDPDGTVNHIGDNESWRYMGLHMHHLIGPATADPSGYQFKLIGDSVYTEDAYASMKWGIAIHDSSYGLIQGNVVYNAAGAGIATEDGSESFNLFEGNFVARVKAGGGRADTRFYQKPRDVGFEGSGFWFSGPNNWVRNNVVADAGYVGYTYFGMYLGDLKVPAFAGADKSKGQYKLINMNATPVLVFSGNEAYGAMADGLTLWWINSFGDASQTGGESVVKDFRVWHHFRYGYYGYPASKITFDGFVARGDPSVLANQYESVTGIWFGDYMSNNITIRNADIQGLRVGIYTPIMANPRGLKKDQIGETVIKDSFLQNYTNIANGIMWSANGPENLSPKKTIIRNVRFKNLPGVPESEQSGPQTNIAMGYGVAESYDVTQSDAVEVYDYNGEKGRDFQVFYLEQHPDFVGPKTGSMARLIGFPEEGLSNRDAFLKYGVAIAGAVSPTTDTMPLVHGLVIPLPGSTLVLVKQPPAIFGVKVASTTPNTATIAGFTPGPDTFTIESNPWAERQFATVRESNPTTTHNVTITGLEPQKRYVYRVRAKNEAGESVTRYFSFTTPAATEETARLERERQAAEAAHLEAERKKADEQARLEAARLEAERQEAARKAAEEQARIEAAHKTAEEARLKAKADEQARLEAARLEAERQEAARKAAEEQARIEAAHKTAEEARLKAEQERIQKLELALEEAQRGLVTKEEELRQLGSSHQQALQKIASLERDLTESRQGTDRLKEDLADTRTQLRAKEEESAGRTSLLNELQRQAEQLKADKATQAEELARIHRRNKELLQAQALAQDKVGVLEGDLVQVQQVKSQLESRLPLFKEALEELQGRLSLQGQERTERMKELDQVKLLNTQLTLARQEQRLVLADVHDRTVLLKLSSEIPRAGEETRRPLEISRTEVLNTAAVLPQLPHKKPSAPPFLPISRPSPSLRDFPWLWMNTSHWLILGGFASPTTDPLFSSILKFLLGEENPSRRSSRR